MSIRLLYEDKNFIAVNKPAGLLVHPLGIKNQLSNAPTEPTVVDWALACYPEIKNVGDQPAIRPGIVHRLDRDTSGVLLVARTQHYFDYLKKLFTEAKIKKTYLALVWGVPKVKRGVMDAPIQLKSGSTKRTVHKGKMTKLAVTEYEVVSSIKYQVSGKEEWFSLLRVMPRTGRTHQVRVHLASLGHPIVGDALYGKKRSPPGRSPVGRQFLHAESIEWSDEEGRRMRIEAGLPSDLQEVLDKIRKPNFKSNRH